MGSIKFDSLFGFAVSEAKKKGDSVSVGFQFNVNDGLPHDAKLTMVQHVLDDIVYPEIMSRIQDGHLKSDFRLQRALLLFYSDSSKNKVLLNQDFKVRVAVKYRDEIKKKNGELVTKDDVEEILGIYPINFEPNTAHITIFKFNGKWYFEANLIYDRAIVQAKFVTSQKYLKIIDSALKDENWSPFIDNLFSVTELAIQSILLLRHYGKYSLKQSHKKTLEIFKAFCETGNTPLKFVENYESLWKLRKQARYLQGTHGREFSIKKTEAEKLLSVTKEMIAFTNTLLQEVDLRAKPVGSDFAVFE